MAHWMLAKKYIPGHLSGEGAEAKSNDIPSGNSNSSGSSNNAFGGSSTGGMSNSSAFGSPFGKPKGPTYNPNAQPGNMLSPGGGTGGTLSGPQRNALLDKITSLEAQQLTLINQLMAQKDEMAKLTPTTQRLEKENKALQKSNELAEKEIEALQEERRQLEASMKDFEGLKIDYATVVEQNTKLTSERAWFEKRYVQSEKYKKETEVTLASLAAERDAVKSGAPSASNSARGREEASNVNLAALEALVKQLTKERDEAQQKLKDVQEENHAMQVELDKSLTANAEYLQKIHDLEKMQSSSGMSARLKELERKNQELEEELEMTIATMGNQQKKGKLGPQSEKVGVSSGAPQEEEEKEGGAPSLPPSMPNSSRSKPPSLPPSLPPSVHNTARGSAPGTNTHTPGAKTPVTNAHSPSKGPLPSVVIDGENTTLVPDSPTQSIAALQERVKELEEELEMAQATIINGQSKRAGPAAEKSGVSSGAPSASEGADGAITSRPGAVEDGQETVVVSKALYEKKKQEFISLNKEVQELRAKLLANPSATSSSSSSSATTVSGSPRGSGASNTIRADGQAFFIPANLHALNSNELISILLSLKDTLQRLQDANDSLASKNFLASHTIARLENAAIRTSELQRYILQQEQLYAVRSQGLQRDLILAQNDREEIVKKLLAESSDQVLNSVVLRSETELKNQSERIRLQANDIETLQKSYRELELFIRGKESEFAEQLHACNSNWSAKLEAQKNASLEEIRTLELKAEKLVNSSTGDAAQLRFEMEKAYEARLAQQQLFWQEKESGWMAEKALMLETWRKEESQWSKEKDAFETMRHTMQNQRKELDDENNKIWASKLTEKDDMWQNKFDDLGKRQSDSDRIIKGMEIQWKRRVEEWKEKESVLIAAIKKGGGMSSLFLANGAVSPGASAGSLDDPALGLALMTEQEKEKHQAAQVDWANREKMLVEALANAKLSESSWKKERESLRTQIDIMSRDLRENQDRKMRTIMSGDNERQGLGASYSGPSADAQTTETKHFESSSAFTIPLSARRDVERSFSGLTQLTEQDYQRRIQHLQSIIDQLQANNGNSVNKDATLALDPSAMGIASSSSSTGAGLALRGNTLMGNLAGTLGGGSGGMLVLQQRLEEKQKEVYALNRRNQRLEEELQVLVRKTANIHAVASTQSANDATLHAHRMDQIQTKYEHEIQQIMLDHQTKIHLIHQEYQEQYAKINATNKTQQLEYLKNLEEIQASHKKHLTAKEHEIEQLKEQHHILVKSIQNERLEEVQRHNSQLLSYKKEKTDFQRALDAKSDEVKLLEIQLTSQEESVRILEQQIENEKQKSSSLSASMKQAPQQAPAAKSSGAPPTDEESLQAMAAAAAGGESIALVAWQKEKRALLEMQLASENSHADELDKVQLRLTQVENELDREREKNKILYTQIQILSERNAKQSRRNITPTATRHSNVRTSVMEAEHDILSEQLDLDRGMPLSARATGVASSPSHGQSTNESYNSRDLAKQNQHTQSLISAAVAEAETTQFQLTQAWAKEKSLLEGHVSSLQSEVESLSLDKSDLLAELTRMRTEQGLGDQRTDKLSKKAQLLGQQLEEVTAAKNQLTAALNHLQSQYNSLSATLQNRATVESKKLVELERNLQAALLDLKRMEMEKLTLHRCVATLTEKCSKLQTEKDALSAGGPVIDATTGTSVSELLKLLSSQITSLTSTVEKQQLRLRLLQSSLEKSKADFDEREALFQDMENALVTSNTSISQAQTRANHAEEKLHRVQNETLTQQKN